MSLSKSLWTKLLAVSLGATMALGIGLSAQTASQEVNAASPQTTTIAAIATKNSWVNGTKYASFTDGAFTFSGSGGVNSTKYYSSSPGTWRFYSTDSPKGSITITGDATVSAINSVTTSPAATFTIVGKSASITVTANTNFASFAITYTSASNGTATITDGATKSLQTTDTGVTLTGTSNGITSPVYGWASDNTSVITVSASGNPTALTIEGVGTATVTLTVTGTGGPAYAYIDITVSAVVQGISIDASSTHSTSCPLWGTYSASGLKIKVDNHMGEDPVITTGFSVSEVDTDILGPQTVTVTLTADPTKTTTYAVKVANSGAAVVYNNIASDLIISEYIEGSSYNKAIEIFNGTGSSVDLSGYSLKKQTNGAGAWSATPLALSGTLANNNVYVVAYVSGSSSAVQAILDQTDLQSASDVVNFNGNDSVALFKSTTLLDVVGIVDQVSPDWGKDATLVRKSSVVNPSATYSVSQWDSYTVDTFTYIGSHTMDTGSADKSLDQATAYAAYLTTGWAATNFCAHTTTVLAEVNAEYNAMHADAKSKFDSNVAFATARTNKAYMTSWAASHPLSTNDTINTISSTSLMAALLIGLIGLSTIAGFYLLKRKSASY